MKNFRYLVVLAALVSLFACGGGGGNSGSDATKNTSNGTTNNGSNTTTSTTTGGVTVLPILELALINSSGAVIADNSVSSGITFARATVKNADGTPVVNKLVTFTVDAAIVTLSPASGLILTNSSGIAKIQIRSSTTSTAGAASLSASAQGISANIDVQTSASNVTLGALTPNLLTLTAYQATSVSVDVAINGSPAASGQVSVNFSSPCGSFTPVSVVTNSLGKAVSTFTATGCSGGSINLSANASGVSNPVTAAVNIQVAAATTLNFVSAIPATIFSTEALFGTKTSRVTFKLVDAGGVGKDGETVNLSISPAAAAAGVVFSDNQQVTTSQATSGGGLVTVNVNSGALPTPLTIDAVLAGNTSIRASSGGLAVNSGAPVQNFFSLSASARNIEGWDYDGELATITLFAADRLAQPVPDGTVISFVAEGGQITASCPTAVNANGKSGCSVSLQSQAFRPSNGRVSVLAYSEGVEPFVDTNGDNVFTPGESYADLGQPFIDANEDGAYDSTEQKIGNSASAGIGALPCVTPPLSFGVLPSSVPNTCNGARGKALVRSEGVFVFSTSFAGVPFISTPTPTGFSIRIQDRNGNAMPYGSVVTADVAGAPKCAFSKAIPSTVASTTEPVTHAILVKASEPGGCSGAVVTVSIKTLKGNETPFPAITLP
jgi:hypothetical protein